MRFFVKILHDIHNAMMANDRHQAPSYPLRMPDDLKAKIADSAQANGRSVHAELLVRLAESFRLNQADADSAGYRMKIESARLEETKLMQQALHLSYCVEVLLQMVRGPDPKGALTAFADIVDIAEKAAADAKKYQAELNPRIRLQEYEKAIAEAESLLEMWRPDMLPWPGSETGNEEWNEPRVQRNTTKAARKKILVGNLGTDRPSHLDDVLPKATVVRAPANKNRKRGVEK